MSARAGDSPAAQGERLPMQAPGGLHSTTSADIDDHYVLGGAECTSIEDRSLANVAAHRSEICAIVESFRASRPRIVGSVARGDHGPGSDLEVLVDFTEEATLLDEVGLRLALENLLRMPVDVIASDSLRGEFRGRILRGAIAV